MPGTQLFPVGGWGIYSLPHYGATKPELGKMLLSGENRKSPRSEARLPCHAARASHAGASRGEGQERGIKGSRRRQGWTLDTRMGNGRAGPVCPGPPLIRGRELVAEKLVWKFRLQPSVFRREYDVGLLSASVSLLGTPSRVGLVMAPRMCIF